MLLRRSWQVGVGLGALLVLAGSAQTAEQGYWAFLRVETLEQKVSAADPGDVRWSCLSGNVLSTRSAFIDPAQKDKQTLSVRYTWSPPPEALEPGKQVTMSLHATIEINSHPNGGRHWGGNGCLAFSNRRDGNIDGIRLTDKTGRQGVLFGNRPQSYASMVCGSTGKITFTGSAEIPDSTWPGVREVEKQKLLDLRVLMNWGNEWRSYQYVYAWKGGPVPAQPPSTPVATPGSGLDVAGTWRHGGGGETWTLTPVGGGRYTAVEKGFGNARGTAVVTGNKLTLDYTTANGTKGRYELTIAGDGRSAVGTCSDVPQGLVPPARAEFTRVSGPTATVPGPTPTPGPGPTPGPAPTPGPTTVAGMTLRAESRKAKTDETVTVPVWLLKGAGLIDMNFNLEYDPTVVQAVGSVVRGNLLEGADFEGNPGKPGVVQVGFVPKAGGVAASEGTVAQIAFKVVGQPGSRTALRLVPRKASLTGGAPANPATIDGEVQVVDDAGMVPGDINGDGRVGMDDVLLALKISVELLPHNPRADVDKDGQVTAADARVIRDRVLGIKG